MRDGFFRGFRAIFKFWFSYFRRVRMVVFLYSLVLYRLRRAIAKCNVPLSFFVHVALGRLASLNVRANLLYTLPRVFLRTTIAMVPQLQSRGVVRRASFFFPTQSLTRRFRVPLLKRPTRLIIASRVRVVFVLDSRGVMRQRGFRGLLWRIVFAGLFAVSSRRPHVRVVITFRPGRLLRVDTVCVFLSRRLLPTHSRVDVSGVVDVRLYGVPRRGHVTISVGNFICF